MTNQEQIESLVRQSIKSYIKNPKARTSKDEYKIVFNLFNAIEILNKINETIAFCLYNEKAINWTQEEVAEVKSIRLQLPIINLAELQDTANRSVAIKDKLRSMSLDQIEQALNITKDEQEELEIPADEINII